MLQIGIQHTLNFIRLQQEEVQLLGRDLYEDLCAELEKKPSENAFSDESSYWPTVQILNIEDVGNGSVKWSDDSTDRNIQLNFYCPCSKENAMVTQSLEYDAPMTTTAVALWVEHWLVTMLEMYLFQQLQKQMQLVSSQAQNTRNELTALLLKEKDI